MMLTPFCLSTLIHVAQMCPTRLVEIVKPFDNQDDQVSYAVSLNIQGL